LREIKKSGAHKKQSALYQTFHAMAQRRSGSNETRRRIL
jgi:hypothetical protein